MTAKPRIKKPKALDTRDTIKTAKREGPVALPFFF